jgi:hypothetical protein
VIKPDGAKYWRLKCGHARKKKLLALSVYPQVTLADARADRDDAKRLLKQGTDPSISRKQQRRSAEVAAANTFEIVARQWHEKQKHQWKPPNAASVIDSLETNVFLDLGGRPIRDVRSRNAARSMSHNESCSIAERCFATASHLAFA